MYIYILFFVEVGFKLPAALQHITRNAFYANLHSRVRPSQFTWNRPVEVTGGLVIIAIEAGSFVITGCNGKIS